jgi:hypothetical protein
VEKPTEKVTNFHLPVALGEFKVQSDEVMYYLYLPISMPGMDNCALPDARLEWIHPLIEAVIRDEPERFRKEYLYLTVKKMFVGGGVTANRPGWHCDGFLSSDLNYVWYDCVPTVFVQGQFIITPDHTESLREFEEQAERPYVWYDDASPMRFTYPNEHLLKLDDRVIHKVETDVPEQLMRTFVKLTLSKERFNLKDNSRNPLLPGMGELYDRSVVRNSPHFAQRDYYKPAPEDHHF